jgi:hypothetical protein
MWVIKINDVDSSCHTQECDANDQKVRFLVSGVAEADIQIVEQDTFNPPQPER